VERGLFKHGTSLAYHKEPTSQRALHGRQEPAGV